MKVNEDAEQHPADARLREMTAERDRWIRPFNRLDAAVARHKRASGGMLGTCIEDDKGLYHAHAQVLRAAGEAP